MKFVLGFPTFTKKLKNKTTLPVQLILYAASIKKTHVEPVQIVIDFGIIQLQPENSNYVAKSEAIFSPFMQPLAACKLNTS